MGPLGAAADCESIAHSWKRQRSFELLPDAGRVRCAVPRREDSDRGTPDGAPAHCRRSGLERDTHAWRSPQREYIREQHQAADGMTPEQIAEHREFVARTRKLSERAEALAKSPNAVDRYVADSLRKEVIQRS